MARLIVCGKDGQPHRIVEAEGKVITIGRSSENHVQIDDLNSSRHHCEIHETSGAFELVDKDSRNGVFVNGHRVQRGRLEAGDKLEIGTTILYWDRVPDGLAHPDEGKVTKNIATGIFSPPGDPTGVVEHLSSVLQTGRLTRPEVVAAAVELAPTPRGDEPTRPRGALGDELSELRRLLQLNKTLNSELNLRRLLERVMDTVIEVSGAERGFLILKDGGKDDPDEFKVKVSRNIDRESIKDAREKISGTIVREVLEHGRSVLLTDAAHDSRYSGRESILSMKLRSVLVVPLRHRERVLGAIYLDNRFASSRFDERAREQLELVADQSSIAIENARLFEENARQREELQHAKEELERLNQTLRQRVEVQDRELVRAREALAAHREEVQLRYDYSHIVTRSPKMLEVFMILDKITDSSVPVLVQGESGTGKELIARCLHYNGPRQKHQFVSENCAAIPTNLMESEFFGYVRGAFTGATADKMGLFELADGGTLFLDEIGDMDLDMQTKLLRVLQDGVLRRVGSKEFKRVDVRLVSATNRDLLALIKEGKFREDLYYRLNVINVLLPPLRERKEDVPLLAEHFLAREAKQAGSPPKAFSGEALDLMLRYDWPGNVREFENEIMRSSAMSKETIRPEHLSKTIVEGPLDASPGTATGARIRSLALSGRTLKELVAAEVDEIERAAITEVLKRCKYKKSKAAQILGVSRPTLDAKIDKYGLSRDAVLTD
ncbi:MAG: sigma 54-interacting transcriptional regulator [Planctomycetota bacterium]|nr:sigma 54-interacting transcriptional regulator [Planctomycetota bacterium]